MKFFDCHWKILFLFLKEIVFLAAAFNKVNIERKLQPTNAVTIILNCKKVKNFDDKKIECYLIKQKLDSTSDFKLNSAFENIKNSTGNFYL